MFLGTSEINTAPNSNGDPHSAHANALDDQSKYPEKQNKLIHRNSGRFISAAYVRLKQWSSKESP